MNLSLGASRVMILKSKQDYLTRLDDPEAEVPTRRLYQKITLPHNSLFVLGWKSNRDFLHSIRADKRLATEKTPAALACDEQRISLTFRTIATFIDATGRVTGQGARRKQEKEVQGGSIGDECERGEMREEKEEIHQGQKQKEGGEEQSIALHEDSVLAQSEALLRAFGDENKTSKFSWEEGYGKGFDIVNFAFVNDAEKE